MPEAATVVVVARDEAAALPGLLRAIGDSAPVLVVDNGSRDATGAVAEAHGATVVREPVPGRGRARQTGLQAARTPLVLLTDARCRPRPGWAAALAGGLADAALAAGPIAVTTPPDGGRVARLDAAARYTPAQVAARGGRWAPTGNLGVRRDAALAAGGFDPRLHRGEDVDLCLRVGGGVAWVPEAVVELPAETTWRGLLRRAHDRGRAQDLLHVRHGLPADTGWRQPGGLVRGDWALTDLGIDPAVHRDLLWPARAWRLARSTGALRGRLARRRYARPR